MTAQIVDFRAACGSYLRARSSDGRVSAALGARQRRVLRQVPVRGDPRLLREIGEALTALLPGRVDAVAGLVLGGVPLATIISQITGLPTLFVREQAKTYGTCRLAEGGDVAGRSVAVVEDVVSSGGAVIKASAELRQLGADVAAVLCVIDRESGGSARLAAHGLHLQSLFTMTDLRRAADV